eukprot:CAMPEP_0168563134 /NCGR_PEP_ID=MMETSP0413-20121227/12515_1 /TAXON_ID=136452 /ORGANISM="Filamoeba nolandi, Strain NC-AS-23-1" /LENGTH=699 /DNA_ID=CAMNT_0008594649 /DNA_START=80 /DNA_END=2179 /DNA_ORIENTATION=-
MGSDSVSSFESSSFSSSESEHVTKVEELDEPTTSKPTTNHHKSDEAPTLTSELSHVSVDLDQALMSARKKGLQPIQLCFEDLSYSVLVDEEQTPLPTLDGTPSEPQSKSPFAKFTAKKPKVWKKILHHLNGVFQPGTLTAIMGSSGAGKTTLLNILAGRVDAGKVEGKILMNGTPRDSAKKSLLRKQAYVMQDDIMLATLTPREAITFSANLRIPETTPEEQRQQRIEEVLDELNLRKCQDTQVGAPGIKRGVSGGERKRVAIGVELVTNPSLLFLDEPTTGLDSFTAKQVVDNLRRLAASGRTIVCTIHQPNSQIFHMFDRLILLAKGHMIYNGLTRDVMRYFHDIGAQPPSLMNPADWFMDVLHLKPGDKEAEERVNGLVDSFEKSNQLKQIKQTEVLDFRAEAEELQESTYPTSYWTQVRYLTQRGFKHMVREPLKMRAEGGQIVFLALLVGLIYLQLENNQDDVQNKMASIFFCMISLMFGSLQAIISTFPNDKVLFFREIGAHMYHPAAYWLSFFIVELPVHVILPIIQGTIIYWMVGFRNDGAKYILFVIDCVLCSNIGGALGFILGVVAPTPEVAFALGPVVMSPVMMFNGFTLTVKSTPVYFIWLVYLSFSRWAFQIALLNEFTDLKLTCSEDQEIAGVCRVSNGNQYIEQLGLDDVSLGVCFIAMIAFYVAVMLLGFVLLNIKSKKKVNA